MFETKPELSTLQRLLDESFSRSGVQLRAMYDVSQRLSSRQLAGFQGVRLVAVATVNSRGEPRVAPRSAAFLHGRFVLAANTESVTVKRLAANPSVAVSYFENHLLIMAHGRASPLLRGTPGFEELRPEWEKAFRGGKDALEGIDLLIEVDATHMVACAQRPERYPAAWKKATHG